MGTQSLLYPLAVKGILAAMFCGLIVGAERQLSGKPAGIRTSMLICLGTYIFIAAGRLIQGNGVDQTRIIAQVVTGIGFIGAGVILTREGIIIGVTSAAVIWVLAGIGILIGLERYITSVVLSFLTVAVLIGVNLLENFVAAFRSGIYSKLSGRRKRKGIGSES